MNLKEMEIISTGHNNRDSRRTYYFFFQKNKNKNKRHLNSISMFWFLKMLFYFSRKREVFQTNIVQRTNGCVSDTLTVTFTVISFLNCILRRPGRTNWAFQQCRSNSIAVNSRGLSVQCFFPLWNLCYIEQYLENKSLRLRL